MKKPTLSALLAVLALGLCSCSTLKSKNAHGGGRHVSSGQLVTAGESLHGKFVVTAVNGSVVALRQVNTPQERASARILVEYGAGILIPQPGTVIERKKGAGFEVRETVRSEDGVVNLYVRDLAVKQR